MVTPTISVTVQYEKTIGRAEFSGPGFRDNFKYPKRPRDYIRSRSCAAQPRGSSICLVSISMKRSVSA